MNITKETLEAVIDNATENAIYFGMKDLYTKEAIRKILTSAL